MDANITQRASRVNTFRVGQASRRVNNAGMAFRDQLRRLRQEKKLTQEQLALACGWGQSRIANYEAPAGRDNARNPDVDEVPLIAKALGVTVAELFGEAASPSQPARMDGVKLAESIAALRQVAKRRGWEYDPETHPLETEYAYALRVAMPATPTTADVIDFGEKLAERLRQKAEGTGGQSDGGSAGSADRKRAKDKRGTASEA